MKIIDCKSIRAEMLKEAKERNPGDLRLTIISVEGDPASEVYIRNKVKTAEEVGIRCNVIQCPNDIEYELLKDVIECEANTSVVTGVILQLPLPDHLKPYERELLDCIPWYKDVDGLSSESISRLWSGLPCLTPATPTGILRLLPEDLSGKLVTVISRSDLIGKPLIKLLLDRNASVSVCHSKSGTGIDYLINGADIVVTGIGRAEYFDFTNTLRGQIWIDCGINRDVYGRLCGDVASWSLHGMDVSITPVPGGVGILTTAQLMLNVIMAYEIQ